MYPGGGVGGALAAAAAITSNLRGWNFTWDGQAGLGHRGGGRHEPTGLQRGGWGIILDPKP